MPVLAQPRVAVIGAGIGGLTTAALLTLAGQRVTVLEAHVYPGGSAGTFYHQGYRFDAGATLAGGFAPGGPHARLAEMLGLAWPVQPVDPAWVTHSAGQAVVQWADREHWRAERQAAFPGSEPFWQRQEHLATLAWDVASRPFPWPPASARDVAVLLAALRPGMVGALPFVSRSVAALAPSASPALRAFLDAQLLIAAQTTAGEANALYGSAALDLPRRGVNQVAGGIGSLAHTLVGWLRSQGAEVLFRQQVTGIAVEHGRAVAVMTNKGLRLPCEAVVGNLTPWGLTALLGDQAPAALRREVTRRASTWGAFTLYLGLDSAAISQIEAVRLADHHQVVADPGRPLGEGNSVFVSLSPTDDDSRAPAGQRAGTLSTHTATAPWWQAEAGPYEERKAAMAERLLATAELALAGLRSAVRLALPGTPVTVARYTRRPQGMVGGFPQTSLLSARGPGTGLPNVWLVGDSVFPGQSTAGVTLSGMRVAAAVVERLARRGWKGARLTRRRDGWEREAGA